MVRSRDPWGGGSLDTQQSFGHRVSAIWELGGTSGLVAVEFGWEGPALGTLTCRMGELETAARSQREEVQAFGKLQPSEEGMPGAFREASGSVFFTLPAAAWALGI